MTGLVHDARLAVRFLIRNRAFALAAVGILGIGISLTATLYAIIRGTLIEPWPYRGYDRLVTIRRTLPAVALRLLAGWFTGFAAGAGLSLVASAVTLFTLALLTTAWPAWRACHTALN